MAPFAQIPDVQRMAVLPAQQQVGNHAVFDHVRGAPLAGDGDVVTEMPPEVVGEVLRSAIDFPSPQHVEAFVIEQEDYSGTFTVRGPDRSDLHCIVSAMDGVRASLTVSLRHFLGLDHANDPWI